VSNALKFWMVATVGSVSAFASAQAMVALAYHAPTLWAARAASPPSGAYAEPLVAAEPAASIAKSSDGHYWANGDVNGAKVRFLVDTGATEVALTPADARKLGYDLGGLNYGYRVVTAAGQTRAAAIRLASVTVAGARLENVDALVIEKGLDTSLLGMTYLGRLASFQATRQALILQR
jgi:aspartyl protease family protein